MWSSEIRERQTMNGKRKLAAMFVAMSVLLSSCGFQLRGSYALPYRSIHVSAAGGSAVAGEIRRELVNSATRVLPGPQGADCRLGILDERRERQILSLSGAGRVREYELRMKVSYQFEDGKGNVVIPTSEIQLKRILAYDDQRVIAKAQEEAMLYRDMERDAAGQILRRMLSIRVPQ